MTRSYPDSTPPTGARSGGATEVARCGVPAPEAWDGQQRYRAQIAPVPSGIDRPFWSVMIPTYNCARYLRETLASVLAQDPGREVMQVEVIDDCSNQDDPEAVVAELGAGRVGFFRQPTNVGHVRNFNTCLQRSRGRLIHILHGDDCVRPGFYRAMQRVFEEHPEIGNAFCRQVIIDEAGRWKNISGLLQPESGLAENWLERIAIGQRLQTPAMVVRREVYEHLGGFDRRIRYYGEDWEMWVRIAAHYPIWHEIEPLALYRIHQSSLSGRTFRTGENIRDLRRALRINRASLPDKDASRISRLALEACALGAIRRARRALARGETVGVAPQILEAFKSSRTPNVLARIAFILLYRAWRALRPPRAEQ